MKKIVYKLFLFVLPLVFLTCTRQKEEIDPADPGEFEFIRLLVSDENSKIVTLVNPATGQKELYEAKFGKAATYRTASGRFGVLVNTADNFVQLFDTGFESHGDHVDIKGTPKWASITGDGFKPTHFKSSGDEIILFNDGDGTIDTGIESEFHTPGKKLTRIQTGNVAHHGAMAKFDNGNYAITEKDGSVAGSLPERVKIINAAGKTVFPSSIPTMGIHGNASNGRVAVFGSISGILVVEANGNQRLIPYPSNYGTAWFSSILEAKAANKFIGYSAAIGAFIIDVDKNAIIPLIENADIMQCKIDYSGNQLITLLHSGEVRIFDLSTNQQKRKAMILSETLKAETQKPQLEATSKFLYITQPKKGEILQVKISDLSNAKSVKVTETPYRISILGVESSDGHQ